MTEPTRPATTSHDWADGAWSRSPADVRIDETGMHVTAVEGSDAWLRTAYGFVHDDAHALLAPFPIETAVEVSFRAEWSGQFDQAGVFVRVDAQRWVKAGVEFADGHLGVGAVVTCGASDWSVGAVDEWIGRQITVRVSRWQDALIVRARADDDPWQLVRVAPFSGEVDATAGPLLCAPSRAGFRATFTRWTTGEADGGIH